MLVVFLDLLKNIFPAPAMTEKDSGPNPKFDIRSKTLTLIPNPMATITVREAIPTITPSVISKVLPRLSFNPLSACIRLLKILISVFRIRSRKP